MPIGAKPADLAPQVTRLRELFAAAGKPAPDVSVMARLPLEDPERAADLARGYADLGATRLVHSNRYADTAELARAAEAIAVRIRPALA